LSLFFFFSQITTLLKIKIGQRSRTPLILASLCDKVEEVKALLKYGADVNAVENVKQEIGKKDIESFYVS
jgi:ankyrin repeat protein